MEHGPFPRPQVPPEDKGHIAELRDVVQQRFGKRACWSQLTIARHLEDGKDVIGMLPTGAGKTLSFWILLAMALDKKSTRNCIIVVAPLNLLSKQNEKILHDAGISAIAIEAKNSSKKTWKCVCAGEFNVICLGPELLVQGPGRDLLKTNSFVDRLLYIVFDEGHCIKLWGKTFREMYLLLGDLRHIIPKKIPFYVPSASLSPVDIEDISRILCLRTGQTISYIRNNDRPNTGILVRKMEHPASSYLDLAFLIPDGWKPTDALPKFLVFFNNQQEAEEACIFLRQRLQAAGSTKDVQWFHATMTPAYREQCVQDLQDGDIWGLTTTELFGMGMDVSDIVLVIQYCAPPDMHTLVQRFGRCGRTPGMQSTGILLVEKEHFDDKRLKKCQPKRKRRAKGSGRTDAPKRTRTDTSADVSAVRDDADNDDGDTDVGSDDEGNEEVLEGGDETHDGPLLSRIASFPSLVWLRHTHVRGRAAPVPLIT